MKNRYLTLIICLTIMSLSMQSQEIATMSFNIRYDTPRDGLNAWSERKETVVSLLKKEHPLFFGLQEARPHQLEYVDGCLKNYAFAGKGRDGDMKGELSPVLYDSTKLQLIKQGTFWLSETPEQVSKGWDAAFPRICSFVLLELKNSNKQFWVFNTHLDHAGPIARSKSAKLILQHIKELNTSELPVILMGDFNATPNEEPIRIIKDQLYDTYSQIDSSKVSERGTFNGFNPEPATRRIDYIFVLNFTAIASEIISTKRGDDLFISDHYPVKAVLIF